MNDVNSLNFDVSVVMPCLNEENTVGLCIRKAQECFNRLGINGQVVISDNGSTDNSIRIASELGAKVVLQPIKGYGAALMKGIEAADGDIIIMGDSDDSYDWGNIGPFISKINEGYDFVMGNRFKGGIEPGAMPPLHRYLGNPVLSFISRIVYRIPIGDFHCGMRAFTKSAYQTMRVRTTGMEFATEMVASASRNNLRITEIPIKLYPDKRGRPPHLRSFRDGWRHLRFIMMYAPDYLYLFPGGLIFLLGLALQLFLAGGPNYLFGQYFGIHFLALGGLFSLAGFNVLTMGVLVKLLVSKRYPSFRTSFLLWFSNSFRLEKGLVFGTLLFLLGLIVTSVILYQWLAYPGLSMEASVHPSFVATHIMVLGLNIVFSSFALGMVVTDDDFNYRTE